MRGLNPRVNRRQFLGATVVASAGFLQACASTPAAGARTNPVAAPFDREIEAFMKARNIPGGALAVVKDRRLVYARGYWWADREKRLAATPRSLFRIASVSKPITAVGVLRLVEDRRLNLDAKAFDLLPERFGPLPSAHPDPRLQQITVRQLLHHTGGWDRDKSFDPMFRPRLIARTVGSPAPADPEAVIRYMRGQPLDFDPGTRYAYSNFGYCVLGRIIERVTGQPYADFIQKSVLHRCGIKDMRIGASLEAGQSPGEVRYYVPSDEKTEPVFPGVTGKVTWPYGGFHLEAMDAHGAWIASAVDLARFAAALHDPASCPLLKKASFEILNEPPAPPASREANGQLAASYYGCGWMVRPIERDSKRVGANAWHSGSLPGTATLLVRRWDGLSWAVLFNQRSEDNKLPDSAIDPALHRAAADVHEWPAHDLFNEFS